MLFALAHSCSAENTGTDWRKSGGSRLKQRMRSGGIKPDRSSSSTGRQEASENPLGPRATQKNKHLLIQPQLSPAKISKTGKETLGPATGGRRCGKWGFQRFAGCWRLVFLGFQPGWTRERSGNYGEESFLPCEGQRAGEPQRPPACLHTKPPKFHKPARARKGCAAPQGSRSQVNKARSSAAPPAEAQERMHEAKVKGQKKKRNLLSNRRSQDGVRSLPCVHDRETPAAGLAGGDTNVSEPVLSLKHKTANHTPSSHFGITPSLDPSQALAPFPRSQERHAEPQDERRRSDSLTVQVETLKDRLHAQQIFHSSWECSSSPLMMIMFLGNNWWTSCIRKMKSQISCRFAGKTLKAQMRSKKHLFKGQTSCFRMIPPVFPTGKQPEEKKKNHFSLDETERSSHQKR